VLRSRTLGVKNFISIAPGEKLKKRCVYYFLSVCYAHVTNLWKKNWKRRTSGSPIKCQAGTGEGGAGITIRTLTLGARRECEVHFMPSPLYHRAGDPIPIQQEAVWTSGMVWMGPETFASTTVRTPDSPARSKALYRLKYPGRRLNYLNFK
jgi:hypothetical protein